MSEMTDERLAAIRACCEAATPVLHVGTESMIHPDGTEEPVPWDWMLRTSPEGSEPTYLGGTEASFSAADAQFYGTARETALRLLDEVARLQHENMRLRVTQIRTVRTATEAKGEPLSIDEIIEVVDGMPGNGPLTEAWRTLAGEIRRLRAEVERLTVELEQERAVSAATAFVMDDSLSLGETVQTWSPPTGEPDHE